MNKPIVSIIIPFYNEERFLEWAVVSALRQTYASIEIILVNDGSTDASFDIAQKFKNEHSNIKLIDSMHHSPGRARNLGIAQAEGVYVLFLDSDDELEPNAAEQMVSKMESERADLVISKFALYDATGHETTVIGWNVGGAAMNSMDTIRALYQSQIVYMVCVRLYKLDIVRQYLFPEGTWFEDTPFLLAYILNSKSISFETQSLSRIHARAGSITRHTIEQRRIEDGYQIFLLELALLQNSAYYEELKNIFFRYHIQTFLTNLIFLCSDRKQVDNLAAIEEAYLRRSKDFKEYLDIASCELGPRTKLNLALVNLPRYLGWDTTFTLLPYLKRKQYQSIHLLRNA